MDKVKLDASDAEKILRAVEEYVLRRDGTIEIRALRDGIRIAEIKRKSVGR